METQTFLDHADFLGCVQSPGGGSGEPPRSAAISPPDWNLTAEGSLGREGVCLGEHV